LEALHAERWRFFREQLILVLHTTMRKTLAYRNPETTDENNHDILMCNEGRTSFFLTQLKKHLPRAFADPLTSVAKEYEVCDRETDLSEWKKIIPQLKSFFPNQISLDHCDLRTEDLIESIKEDMIKNQQNQSVRLRCGEPCPLCGSPCTGHFGHDDLSVDDEKRHNCEHQPGGIAGGYWKPTDELYYLSYTQAFFANHSFERNDKWISFKEFSNVFEDWKSPEKDTNNPQSKVRQFIFYNYQTELHERYPTVKPCASTPASYNHPIEHLFIEVNKFLEEN
jgi:hypothetical protein